MKFYVLNEKGSNNIQKEDFYIAEKKKITIFLQSLTVLEDYLTEQLLTWSSWGPVCGCSGCTDLGRKS